MSGRSVVHPILSCHRPHPTPNALPSLKTVPHGCTCVDGFFLLCVVRCVASEPDMPSAPRPRYQTTHSAVPPPPTPFALPAIFGFVYLSLCGDVCPSRPTYILPYLTRLTGLSMLSPGTAGCQIWMCYIPGR